MILSKVRRSRLMNQWTLGKILGWSQAKVSMIERGQTMLTDTDKQRIAEALSMPVTEIQWPEAEKDRGANASGN